MMPADLVRQVIRDGNLEEMPRNSFMAENWARLLDGCANGEVLAVWRVGGNEVETAAVVIVDARRMSFNRFSYAAKNSSSLRGIFWLRAGSGSAIAGFGGSACRPL